MPARAAKIEIPRWIQLVGLPSCCCCCWVVAGAVRHVVFLFLVGVPGRAAAEPARPRRAEGPAPSRLRSRARVPRVRGCLIAAIVALGTVLVSETKTAAKRVDSYFTDVNGRTHQVDADRDVDRLQAVAEHPRLGSIHVQNRGHQLVRDIRKHDVGKYTNKVVDFLEGAAISIGKLLFSLIVLIVVSVYMLLDFPRFARPIDRAFPPHPGSEPLLVRMEHSLVSYVQGPGARVADHRHERRRRHLGLGAIGASAGREKYALSSARGSRSRS
jgi:hypothetical protein